MLAYFTPINRYVCREWVGNETNQEHRAMQSSFCFGGTNDSPSVVKMRGDLGRDCFSVIRN